VTAAISNLEGALIVIAAVLIIGGIIAAGIWAAMDCGKMWAERDRDYRTRDRSSYEFLGWDNDVRAAQGLPPKDPDERPQP
jgi:hypothetical protein